jgi:hypothetical protein
MPFSAPMKSPLAVVFALLLAGCASTAAVDMNEPRRIVGTESSIRIDGQIVGEEIQPGAQIPMSYEITNMRSTPIAIAELVPETSYDQDTNTFTVTIGSEVPGNELLPRLIEIAPGEKRTFTTSARVQPIVQMGEVDPLKPLPPSGLRLKVNFLGDTAPFRKLIGISERAVADRTLADALFPLWLEHNEIVYTNSVPMRWATRRSPTR